MVTFEKAKPLSWKGYGTRKSRTTRKLTNAFYRWYSKDYYWQTKSSRSKRRKWLLNYNNRKLRRLKDDLASGGAYKKLYDVQRFLD